MISKFFLTYSIECSTNTRYLMYLVGNFIIFWKYILYILSHSYVV